MSSQPESLLSPEALTSLEWLARTAPPGAFVEVGVYKGGSAAVLYRVAQEQDRQLFLYDTFKGTPFYRPGLDGNRKHSFADVDFAEICRLFPKAIIVKGVFPATARPMGTVAFVHADADQYDSTAAICSHFPPIMAKGGTILFDDYGVSGCDGCTKAVNEAFGDRITRLDTGKAAVQF